MKNLLSLLILIIVFLPTSARATGAFKVSNVEVDITASDAVQAREQAFLEARNQAFDKLAARLLTDNEIAAMDRPDDLTISGMVENFEIVSESVAPNRYKGVFNYAFKENVVRQFFEGGGYSFSAMSGDTLLILPFYEEDGLPELWAEDNPWYGAWKEIDTYSEGLIPMLVPLGDVEDIGSVNEQEPLNYDQNKLGLMADRYKAKSVLIALASVNEDTADIFLYGTEGLRPAHLKTFSLKAENLDKDAFKSAVRDVYAFLQRDWKNQTATSQNSQKASLLVEAKFNGLGEWVAYREALERISGVTSYDTVSLNPSGAELRLHFSGSFERLSIALGQENLYVEQPSIQGYYDSHGIYRSHQKAGELPQLKWR